VFVVTDVTEPPFDPGSAQAQRYTERLGRTMTEELFEQYVRRLEADIGTTINQDALARIRGGSAE
jgi:peptidyl-prolyl cis-trans isomerase D